MAQPPWHNIGKDKSLGGHYYHLSFNALIVLSVYSREHKYYFWGPELMKDNMDDTGSNNKGTPDLDLLIQNTLLGFLNHKIHDINPVDSLSHHPTCRYDKNKCFHYEFGFKTKYGWWQLDLFRLCYIIHNFLQILPDTHIYTINSKSVCIICIWDSTFWWTGKN